MCVDTRSTSDYRDSSAPAQSGPVPAPDPLRGGGPTALLVRGGRREGEGAASVKAVRDATTPRARSYRRLLLRSVLSRDPRMSGHLMYS